MNKLVVSGFMALMIVAASVGAAQAQKELGKGKKNVIYVAADRATFSQSPTAAGVSMAVLWGDPNKGPHGTFTKFEPRVGEIRSDTSEVGVVTADRAGQSKDQA